MSFQSQQPTPSLEVAGSVHSAAKIAVAFAVEGHGRFTLALNVGVLLASMLLLPAPYAPQGEHEASNGDCTAKAADDASDDRLVIGAEVAAIAAALRKGGRDGAPRVAGGASAHEIRGECGASHDAVLGVV